MPLIIGSIVTLVLFTQIAPDFTLKHIEVISKVLAVPMLIGILGTISKLFSAAEDKILSSITKTKWVKIREDNTEIVYADSSNTDDPKSTHSNGWKWVRK